MYLNQVELRLVMDQVHTLWVLLFTSIVTDRAPSRGPHGLTPQSFLISYLPQLLVKLAQCTLSYSKLQEGTFDPAKIGPDNVPYTLCCQTCALVILPSYSSRRVLCRIREHV